MKKKMEEAKLELVLIDNDIIVTSTGAGTGEESGDGFEVG